MKGLQRLESPKMAKPDKTRLLDTWTQRVVLALRMHATATRGGQLGSGHASTRNARHVRRSDKED
eukprot:5300944-Amphidinium_carterae.1